MDELPAGTLLVLLAVARHAVAGLAETPQFLDIQMQQITRLRLFVAQHRRWLQFSQAMQAEPPEATRHGANGYAGVVGYLSIGLACSTLLDKAIKQGA